MAKFAVALMGYYKSTCEIRENAWTPVKRILAYGYHLEPHYADADSWVGEGKGYGGSGYAKLTQDKDKAAGIPQQLTVARCVMTPELVHGGYRLPLFENRDGHYFATKTFNFSKAENDGQYLWWDAASHHIYTYDPIWYETKVAKPGDVVGYMPWTDSRKLFSETERKHFLIMNMEGVERNHMSALKEPYYDLTSYKQIDPTKLTDIVWIMPSRYTRKRRFHVALADLETMKVDLEQMLTKDLVYEIDAEIESLERTNTFDKIRDRYTAMSDGLNVLAPVEVKPMRAISDGVL